MASSPLNHASGVVRLAGNPYAAMPSLHAADALIVGVLALLVRPLWLKVLWLLWPCWVAFALMASGTTSGSTSSWVWPSRPSPSRLPAGSSAGAGIA